MMEVFFENVNLFLQPNTFFLLSFEVYFVLVENIVQLFVLYVVFESNQFPATEEIICFALLLVSDCFKNVRESVIHILDYSI